MTLSIFLQKIRSILLAPWQADATAIVARAFLLVWSLGAYLHYAEEWRHPAETLLALLVCLSVSFVPNLRWVWFLTLTISILSFLPRFPGLANHANFFLLTSIFLLIASFRIGLRRREVTLADLRFLSRAALLGLCVVYVWAAVDKINADYFDLEVSCATNMFNRFASQYLGGPLPSSQLQMWHLPELSILVELLAPMLLFFRRTFFAGVITALALHLVLASIGFVDFSSIAFAILVFYILAHLEMKTEVGKSVLLRRRIVALVLIYFWSEIVAGVLTGLFGESKTYHMQILFFCGSVIGLMLVLLKVEKDFGIASFSLVKFGHRDARGLWILPTLLFAFGSLGYLGLNTSGNFSMFSNLRVEGSEWNHAFIPKALRVFSYQDEIFFVEAVSPESLKPKSRFKGWGMGVNRLELDRQYDFWRRDDNWPAVFKLRSADDVFDGFDRFPKEQINYSWAEKKFLAFRPVQPPGPNRCRR